MKTAGPWWLLAMGVLLATATQWRVPGAPFGPSEALIGFWMVLELKSRVSAGRGFQDRWVKLASVWWLASMALMLLGILVRHLLFATTTLSDLFVDWVDWFAYFYVAAFSCVLLARLDPRGIARLKVFLFFAFPTAMVLILGLGIIAPGIAEPWYEGIRFQGWSVNPNQIAMVLAPAPFWLPEVLAASPRHWFPRFAILVAILELVVISFITGSDALKLSWGLGLIAYLGTLLLVWLRKGGIAWLERVPRALVLFFLLVTVVGIGGLGVNGRGASSVDFLDLTNHEHAGGSEGFGADRTILWRNAFRAVRESWVTGLGPGPHSGYPGPHDLTESHNTFIEWLTKVGVLGALPLFLLLGALLVRSVTAGRPGVAAELVALFAFSNFHVTLRQPFFWLVIAASLVTLPMAGFRLRFSLLRKSAD